jgi:catechol 2,3-dioxygenase-like lactoylglutathione lyase family enzyme
MVAVTAKRHIAVRGHGEIALRVNNLDAMQQFYGQVIGLPLMARFSNSAFFKIADAYGGHIQVLALFDRSQSPDYHGTDAATFTIDHIAFEIPLVDFAAERTRLEALGFQVETAEHAWVHWHLCDRSRGQSSGASRYGSVCVSARRTPVTRREHVNTVIPPPEPAVPSG